MTEAETFEEFFEGHRRQLFGALCLITGNRFEAEEIAQEAFVRVWERWDRVAAMDEPVGFLFRTAMNLFRNRVRRAAVAARKAIGLMPGSDDLAKVEDRDEVVRAMRPLTPHQRAAVVLTDYMGYSSEEAARILGIKGSTVRSLASRGRSAVRATTGSQR